MCGIYTYLGNKPAKREVLAGLSRLLYRGYDSWGVAEVVASKIKVEKNVGILDLTSLNLNDQANAAVAHTRWATHGKVSQVNAHPHLASNKSFALVHNGIVENFHELKAKLLKAGQKFKSETDTEVIVKLIKLKRDEGLSWPEALQAVYKTITGRNTIAILTNTGEIWAVRYGSPLVVGQTPDGVYLSSDVVSLDRSVKQVAFVDNLWLVHIAKNRNLEFLDLKTLKKIKPKFQTLKLDFQDEDKGGYDHYMLKEINESPFVVRQLLKQADSEALKQAVELVKQARAVYLIGSGSAGVAAGQAAYYLRTVAQVPAVNLIGADADSYLNLFDKDSILIALSQSGETADVIEVLEKAKTKGAKLVSYVNMPGSMMTQLADVSQMANAKAEICVMSTKVVLSQMAFGYLLTQALNSNLSKAKKDLNQLALTLEELLADQDWLKTINKLALKLKKETDIYLLGKSEGFFIVKEGMIKLIEGAYVHTHALPAGDLKHYVITIVEEGTPVIGLISSQAIKKDLQSALTEVKARGATTIALSYTDDVAADEIINLKPLTALTELEGLVALQLLGYYLAKALGHNIDKPRHIAKSVTVK